MNMKALLGAVLALVLAVGGAAFLVASFAKPSPPPPEPAAEAIKDQLDTNPFDLISPGPKPKVVVDMPYHQFGAMILGAEQSHDFVFKNEGEGPMRLAKGHLMCKCTIPVVPDQEIKPGESISIKLTWKPVDSSRDFSKEAVIWTNDPANPRITLSIKGEVYDDPMSYPSEFALGDVTYNKEHESEVNVVSSTSTEMKIDSVEVSHPQWMTVTWAPSDIEKLIDMGLKSPKPLSGFAVKLKIIPNESVGPFNGWIKLKSNLKDEVKMIDIVGVRTGPISIHGQDYQAAMSMVDMPSPIPASCEEAAAPRDSVSGMPDCCGVGFIFCAIPSAGVGNGDADGERITSLTGMVLSEYWVSAGVLLLVDNCC